MLERDCWESLVEWKRQGVRKALLIKGARQIGKTTLVREFGKRNYDSFVEINFLADPQASLIFDDALDADTVISRLTAYARKPLHPGKTLVLLDEVQECSQARTAIKFLVSDGRFDYIETGSLLGVKTGDVTSYPVGFEEHLSMYPLTFGEFCRANGVQQETFDYLKDCFERVSPVGEAIHRTMLQLLYAYLVVGGMPEVVQRYVNTHDVAQVVDLQRDLLALYRLDIAKYAEANDKAKIRAIFDAVPSQLDDKNRRFVLADLGKTARQERYRSSFLWLADAGVVLPCYNVSEPAVPLEANSKHSLMKLFMSDVGLLAAASMEGIQFDLLQGNIGVNMGSIMENAIAQELRAHGFPLYYFNSRRTGEVDFVVQSGKKVLPVEVKSGNDWGSHKALENVLSTDEWGIDKAYVFCKGDMACKGSVIYAPLYMAMFLEPERLPKSLRYEVDLSALPGSVCGS